MLHVRMLDNLETQKAVASYDMYEQYFNEACKLSQYLASSAPERDELVPMVIRETGPYKYFERLEKPESTTLDYKSYFSNPVEEVESKAVKFMCGFLNALGMGKIVVGVYEMPRGPVSLNLTQSPSIDTGSSNSIVTHNMMVEQIVVGVSITDEDMQILRGTLTAQLQDCLPPIPPSAVKIESIPVTLPTSRLEPAQLLLLYDTQISGARDSFKQKSNFAIRQLGRSNISICPLELDQYPELASLMPSSTVIAQIYAIVPCDTQAESLMQNEDWASDLLLGGLDKARGRSSHQVVAYAPGIALPQLRVVEISVAIQDCPAPFQQYKGKFFCGWPSIPLWDPVTSTVRRVERNYNIRSGVSQQQARMPAWLQQHSVLSTVIDFLCGPNSEDLPTLLNLRRVHSALNKEHESRLGTELVTLLQRTPPGSAAVVQMSAQAISGMQSFLKSAQLALMPLLLCRIYNALGVLPSPFPYMAVPLPYQAMRISGGLIPIYYLHTPHMGALRLAVVLDCADGVLKTIRWKENGQKIVQLIMGIGFDRIDAVSQQYFRPQRRASTTAPQSPNRSIPSSSSSSSSSSKLVKFAFLCGWHDSHFHGEPWTLRHLLIWLRLAVHDPHVHTLSFAENAFGFCCEASEICASHFAESRLSRPETPECFATPVSTIYPSSFDCAMHRAMADWSHFCS